MKKNLLTPFITLCALILLCVAYLFIKPNHVDAVAWQAPTSPGYTNQFGPNQLLKRAQTLPLPEGYYGPESIAVRSDGSLFFPTHQKWIMWFDKDSKEAKPWIKLEGFPLGIQFDAQDNLIVADALKGLLKISPDKTITVLSSEYKGQPHAFVDDLDIGLDGKIYFSDASNKPWFTKLGVPPYRASQFDIVEHGGHGKLYVYDPQSQKTKLLLDQLQFANGVALSQDESFVLVNETGSYQVTRYWLKGEKKGQSDVFIGNLPGFPDNITRAPNGSFWLALIGPRSPALDALSNWPKIRKAMLNLPSFMLPVGPNYDYIVHLGASGNVLKTLQDPDAKIGKITSALEHEGKLYLGSLSAPLIGIYPSP